MDNNYQKKIIKIVMSGLMVAGMFSLAGTSTYAKTSVNEPPAKTIEAPSRVGNISYLYSYTVEGKDIAWGAGGAISLLAARFSKAATPYAIAGIIVGFPGYQDYKIVTQVWRDNSTYKTFNRVTIYDKNWKYVRSYKEK